MITMITEHSHGRITLALDIGKPVSQGKYKGYHTVTAIKAEIDLSDTVSVSESAKRILICDHPGVPSDESNICSKAISLMKSLSGNTNEVSVEIEKRIPVMGGLAGGSSNAAAVMRALLKMWRFQGHDLATTARDIGMDVPFFFFGGVCKDTEATGNPEPIACLTSFDVWLIIPSRGVSTREAYAAIDHSKTGRNTHLTLSLADALARGDHAKAFASLHNDFEEPLRRIDPESHQLIRYIRNKGIPAALSGSGSTIVAYQEVTDLPGKPDIIKTRIRCG